jgi:hypothetical protein
MGNGTGAFTGTDAHADIYTQCYFSAGTVRSWCGWVCTGAGEGGAVAFIYRTHVCVRRNSFSLTKIFGSWWIISSSSFVLNRQPAWTVVPASHAAESCDPCLPHLPGGCRIFGKQILMPPLTLPVANGRAVSAARWGCTTVTPFRTNPSTSGAAPEFQAQLRTGYARGRECSSRCSRCSSSSSSWKGGQLGRGSRHCGPRLFPAGSQHTASQRSRREDPLPPKQRRTGGGARCGPGRGPRDASYEDCNGNGPD